MQTELRLRDHVDGCQNKVDVHARYVMFSDKFGEPCDCPYSARIPIDIETMSVRQLRQILQPELEAITDNGIDYFELSVEAKYTNPARLDQPIGDYRWIACYAVTGGSEGHYIHVDRIHRAEGDMYGHLPYVHEPIFLIKTFGGYAIACTLAAYLGERLGA